MLHKKRQKKNLKKIIMIKEREKKYETLGMCGIKKIHIYMKKKRLK